MTRTLSVNMGLGKPISARLLFTSKPYDIHANKKETRGPATSRTPENFARQSEKRSPKSKATCQEDCAPNKAQTVEKSLAVVRRTVGVTLSRALGLYMMLES